MSTNPSSAVYVTERDLSQTIAQASTSIAAIVFASARGRVGERVFISSPQAFLDEFGEPNAQVGFGHHAALAFLDEANQLYCVRAIGEDYQYGGVLLQRLLTGYSSVVNYALANPSDYDPMDVINGSVDLNDNLAYFHATGPGSYADNIAVAFTSDNLRKVGTVTTRAPYTAKHLALTNRDLSAPVDVIAVAATNIALLSGTASVGGTSITDGDFVLLTAQTLAEQNGRYKVVTAGWEKQADPTYVRKTGGTAAFYRKTATYVYTMSVETVGVTAVANDDVALFVAQSVSTQNGIYKWAATTGVWTKQFNQTLVAINGELDRVYRRTGGVYLRDTRYPGGMLQAGTYDYFVAPLNTTGEQIATAVSYVATLPDSFVTLSWAAVAGATSYKVYGRTTGGTFGLLATVSTNEYIDYGRTTPVVARQPATVYVGTPTFYVNVYNLLVNATVPLERFECTLQDAVNGFGVQTELEAQINNQSTGSKLVRVVNSAKTLPTVPLIHTSAKQQLLGGASGAAVADSDLINGWKLFEDKEQVALNILINGGYSSPAVQLEMDRISAKRMDTIAILDLPTQMQAPQAAVDWRNNELNLNSNYSALYGPDLLVNDSYSGKNLWVPPSGHVAAVYARTDRVAETWYAPAGLNRGLLRVLGVRQVYNQGDRDLLQPAQINYVRKFPGQGYAIMESYTMQAKLSALSFVPVRRMMMVIETAVSKALLYSLWEPNDPVLRTQIVSMIGDYLEMIKRRRGITRYLVVCDDSNNGPQSYNSGTLNVDVYIQPVLPVARISLQMVITKEGMSFQEAILAAGQF